MQSILQQNPDECFLCGRAATDWHHVFGGALRSKSEYYGLKVRLCRNCHTEGTASAHKCRETDLILRRLAQRKAMEIYGLTTEQFIGEFRKNYL